MQNYQIDSDEENQSYLKYLSLKQEIQLQM